MKATKFPIILLILGLFLVPWQSAFAQNWSFGASYWGEAFFHPGIKLSADTEFWQKNKSKTTKKGKEKQFYHSLYAAPHLGYFVHPASHQGLVIGSDLGYRIIKKKTFQFESFINLAYLAQINSGPTYVLDTDGTIYEASPIRSYALVGTGFGIGQDFRYAPRPKQWAWQLRPNLSWQLPYNAMVLPRFFMEAGIRYYPFKSN